MKADKEKIEKKKDVVFNIEEMAQAGLHFGHKVSMINPKMKPYIFGIRNSVHVIDLDKTVQKFKEALDFIREIVSQNKTLLIVGTKIQVRNLVKEMAKDCNLPYVTERWLGGTFTNFQTIKKRIDYVKDLGAKKASGELDKYTKKEKAEIDDEIRKFEIHFGGIKDLNQLPDAIFVLDIKKDALAVREAKSKGVKVIGITDTNVNPDVVDYPIPANDDAVSSIKYILDKVTEVIKKTKTDKK